MWKYFFKKVGKLFVAKDKILNFAIVWNHRYNSITMTKEEEKALHTFETRTRQLILAYQELKAENAELWEMMQKKEGELEAMKAEVELHKQNYANLKLAKMIELNDSDLKDAKQRLAKLVRDVDKCIALLNV